MTFAVHTDTRGSATILSVTGDIDLSTTPRLLAGFASLGEAAPTNVVVDLTEVGFLDSSALGALVGAQKEIQERGGRMTVICSNPQILRIFALTRLASVMTIVADRDAVPE